MKRLIISLILFLLALIQLDRYFFKKNDGFCIHHIFSKLSYNPEWNTDSSLPEVLRQRFHYLDKGSQSYVFVSEDQKWVLKFYKFPSHMRKISWLKHPFSYLWGQRRLKIKDHNEKRFALSFCSYKLALSELSQETGVSYIHLNPTSDLKQFVVLVDKLGMHYNVPLDTTAFVVQRKAKPILSVAGSKEVVDGFIDLIVARCKKGISDLDAMLHDNYGWLDDHAVHIDIGRFVRDERVKSPAAYKQEVIRITQHLSDTLAKNDPELYTHYRNKVDHLAE